MGRRVSKFYKTFRNGFILNSILSNSAVKILPLPTQKNVLPKLVAYSFFQGFIICKERNDLVTSTLLKDRERGKGRKRKCREGRHSWAQSEIGLLITVASRTPQEK